MHENEVAADLKISRRESGLSNKDLAHLLGIDCARVSRLENAKTEPTVGEICALSLIYGKQLDGLLRCAVPTIAVGLAQRIDDVPAEPDNWDKYHENRLNTLHTLYQRLENLTKSHHDN